jgi:prophage regulatory protein
MNEIEEQLWKHESALDRIVFKSEVCELVGLGASTVNKLEREGRFPRRVKIGDPRTGWRLSDIQAWFDALELVSGSNREGK